MADNESDCPMFAPDASYNPDRGTTTKQSDASPLDEKMRRAIEARVGLATPVMTQMKSGQASVFDL